MAEEYIYAVTRVHMAEQNLLSTQDLEQMISLPKAEDVFRFLADKGWGNAETPTNNAEALLAAETEKTWGLIQELAGEIEPFNVFRYANDYHNVKAAIKLSYVSNEEKDQEHYFIPYGTVATDKIKKAASEHDFSSLPENLAKAGQEAYEVLVQTSNGQQCDMVLDRAALCDIGMAGEATNSELLRRYAEIVVDAANIKAAVRCQRMGKKRDFIDRVLAPVGSLDIKTLKETAADKAETIYAYLETTAYAGAVEALKTSMAAFESWCEDEMIRMIRPQRTQYFGLEPLAAFILGRENEIRMARLILSTKINHLSNDSLRERLREMYV